MNKRNFVFFGGGFLASHIMPTILPFAETITIVDRERIEGGNYDNAIYPKGLNNTRKATALSNLINILHRIPIRPMMINFNYESFDLLPDDINFAIVTFDNIESRVVSKDFIREKNIIGLNIGVTENFGIVEWMKHQTIHDNTQIRKKMEEVADVCERIEFRTLGSILAALTNHVIYDFLETGNMRGYIINNIGGKIITTVI